MDDDALSDGGDDLTQEQHGTSSALLITISNLNKHIAYRTNEFWIRAYQSDYRITPSEWF